MLLSMSGDEKAAQIGNAVSEYQTAKIELAHIEKKIETIFETYRTVGACMDKSRGTVEPPKIKEGKLDLGWRSFDPGNLLNSADLIAVIKERDTAQARLDDARREMRDLGITGVD